MSKTCLNNQEDLKQAFASCQNSQDIYTRIISLGAILTPVAHELLVPENLVEGCQSRMYLYTSVTPEKTLEFQAASDALISKGLAYLLIKIYNNESPETILKCQPDVLTELGIYSSLSPTRTNGLKSLHLRMKQEALKRLI